MSRRPAVDLSSITSEAATPMTEAVQRTPRPAAPPSAPTPPSTSPRSQPKAVATKTADLQPLAFKVPPAFRKRFRQHAANADLKLNELLFEALDAWEDKKGLKR